MDTTMIPEEMEETKGFNIESIEELKDNLEDDLDGNTVSDSDKLTIRENLQSLEGVITERDVAEYSKYSEGLNFIELMKAQRELNSYVNTMQGMKNTTESLMRMKADMDDVMSGDDTKKPPQPSTIVDDISLSNMEDDVEWKDAQTFLDNYDTSMANLDLVRDKVEELLKQFEDIPKTSSYMNNAMLELIDKNLKKIEDLNFPSCYKRANKFYLTQKNVFSHRDSVDYIVSKLPDKKIMIRNLKKTIKADEKKGRKDAINATQKNVSGAFGKVFNVNQLVSFENYLADLYGDKNDAFYVQYALYLIYSKEKQFGKYGNHKWVEVIIMNVIDILSDKYDLESGKEHYNEELLRLREAIK